jgi:hypothetical protein
MAVQCMIREGRPVTVAGIVNALTWQGFTPEEAEREGAAILQRAWVEVEAERAA